MALDPSSPDAIFEDPAPADRVSFSVLCRPPSGIGVEQFEERVAAADIDDLDPDPSVLARVAAELEHLGFTVLPLDDAPIVAASGEVRQFETVFRTRLVRMIWRWNHGHGTKERADIVVQEGAPPPFAAVIPGAILISLPEPPLLAEWTSVVGPSSGSCLSMPDGVAVGTGAAATHQLWVPSGKPAKGKGITVAVVDSGFARHAHFTNHGYTITRIAAPDTSAPEVDLDEHGTLVLANLLACAPEVHAYGVKFLKVDIAFAKALSIKGVKVISLSWCYKVRSLPLPQWLLSLRYLILRAFRRDITVVVAAGDRMNETMPAAMPQVIAVGGVTIDPLVPPKAWQDSTNFTSSLFPARKVPDLCGIASDMMLPIPGDGMQCREGATSCATPQVAGVAALLLQKTPALTPEEIRSALAHGAVDVVNGIAFGGTAAAPGPDSATGAGFVNALSSWHMV